jgi:hypothetical protein
MLPGEPPTAGGGRGASPRCKRQGCVSPPTATGFATGIQTKLSHYFSFLSFFLLVVKTEFNAILAWFCSSLVARPPEEVICASTRDGSWGGENENDAANAKRSQWGGDDEKLRMNKPRQMKERTGESAAAEPAVDSAAEIWKRGSRCIITRERNLLSSIYVLG